MDVNNIELTPNSHRYKAEQKQAVSDQTAKKKVKKVASGKTKKKSGISRFADSFISEDVSNVKSYIVGDVLIPAAKKLVSDIVTNGIDILLYGEAGHKKNSSGNSVNYISYNRFSDKRDDRRTESYSSSRTGFTYDDVIVGTKTQAENVLSQLQEIIENYDMTSISDLYEAAGIEAPFTYNKYGWKDISEAQLIRISDGWLIKMPKAILIK